MCVLQCGQRCNLSSRSFAAFVHFADSEERFAREAGGGFHRGSTCFRSVALCVLSVFHDDHLACSKRRCSPLVASASLSRARHVGYASDWLDLEFVFLLVFFLCSDSLAASLKTVDDFADKDSKASAAYKMLEYVSLENSKLLLQSVPVLLHSSLLYYRSSSIICNILQSIRRSGNDSNQTVIKLLETLSSLDLYVPLQKDSVVFLKGLLFACNVFFCSN